MPFYSSQRSTGGLCASCPYSSGICRVRDWSSKEALLTRELPNYKLSKHFKFLVSIQSQVGKKRYHYLGRR